MFELIRSSTPSIHSVSIVQDSLKTILLLSWELNIKSNTMANLSIKEVIKGAFALFLVVAALIATYYDSQLVCLIVTVVCCYWAILHPASLPLSCIIRRPVSAWMNTVSFLFYLCRTTAESPFFSKERFTSQQTEVPTRTCIHQTFKWRCLWRGQRFRLCTR